jgi:hypothetical protein
MVLGKVMRTVITLWLLAFAAIASAHHSRSHYSQEIQEVEGELVSVHWVNPHVGFTVKVIDEDGLEQLWRVEGVSNLLGMQRGGITPDTFTIGDHVKAVGSPSVRRARDLLTTSLLLSNGTEVLLSRNAEPYWTEEAISAPRASNSELVDASSENRGIFRVWSAVANGVGQKTRFPFTETAINARNQWDPIDNFAERCEPEGMPRIMRNPHPFEFVNNNTEIALLSELYDLVRTIHMDRSAPPANASASPLGFSTGHWEENSLIVLTTRINWPYFDNIGTPQSEAVEMLETFTLSTDQSRLDYRLVITDPTTFAEPAVYERYWLAFGEDIERFDCQVY